MLIILEISITQQFDEVSKEGLYIEIICIILDYEVEVLLQQTVIL